MNGGTGQPAPPVPPRQTKSDEKTLPTLLVKQSNPVNSSLIDNNHVNARKGLSINMKIINEIFSSSSSETSNGGSTD